MVGGYSLLHYSYGAIFLICHCNYLQMHLLITGFFAAFLLRINVAVGKTCRLYGGGLDEPGSPGALPLNADAMTAFMATLPLPWRRVPREPNGLLHNGVLTQTVSMTFSHPCLMSGMSCK